MFILDIAIRLCVPTYKTTKEHPTTKCPFHENLEVPCKSSLFKISVCMYIN